MLQPEWPVSINCEHCTSACCICLPLWLCMLSSKHFTSSQPAVSALEVMLHVSRSRYCPPKPIPEARNVHSEVCDCTGDQRNLMWLT